VCVSTVVVRTEIETELEIFKQTEITITTIIFNMCELELSLN